MCLFMVMRMCRFNYLVFHCYALLHICVHTVLHSTAILQRNCQHSMARPHVVVCGSAYRCGRLLRIYWIGSYGQPTLGGSPDWVLGEVLTNLHRKNLRCCKIFQRPEHGLRVYKKWVPRKIFGLRKDELTRERAAERGGLWSCTPSPNI